VGLSEGLFIPNPFLPKGKRSISKAVGKLSVYYTASLEDDRARSYPRYINKACSVPTLPASRRNPRAHFRLATFYSSFAWKLSRGHMANKWYFALLNLGWQQNWSWLKRENTFPSEYLIVTTQIGKKRNHLPAIDAFDCSLYFPCRVLPFVLRSCSVKPSAKSVHQQSHGSSEFRPWADVGRFKTLFIQ